MFHLRFQNFSNSLVFSKLKVFLWFAIFLEVIIIPQNVRLSKCIMINDAKQRLTARLSIVKKAYIQYYNFPINLQQSVYTSPETRVQPQTNATDSCTRTASGCVPSFIIISWSVIFLQFIICNTCTFQAIQNEVICSIEVLSYTQANNTNTTPFVAAILQHYNCLLKLIISRGNYWLY